MKNIARIICIFSLLSYPILATAEQKTASLNIMSDSAINTQSAEVQTKGTWSFSLRNDSVLNRQFSNPQLFQFSALTGRQIESDGYLNFTFLAAAYGLSDTLTIGAIFPYIAQTHVRLGELVTSENNTEFRLDNQGTSQGFGDATLYGQWLILDNEAHQFSAMFNFGSALPTGTTNVKSSDGMLFTLLDQPGQGAWKPFIGAAITKTIKKESFSANLIFTKGLKGAQDTNLGNVYDYNIAWVHQLYESKSKLGLSGIVEINGEYTTNTITNHIKDPDSGGNVIYFTLGIRANTAGGMSPYIATSPPLLQTLNGIQSPVTNWFTCGIDITK